jgi:ketosteroid isomerase-like protein
MTTNTDLITSFYEAFQRKDHEAMNACYDPSIVFSDPVFQRLEGQEVMAMWHMLCERGTDLVVSFSDVAATEDRASAHWEATYTLGGSDRQIDNVVEAQFNVRDGLIYRHLDSFDLWKWSRMALGTPGTLLGWSGPLKNKVRDRARRQLDRFMSEHPEYDA